VVRAAFELTADVTDLLVACAFPDVVAASVKRARTPQGVATVSCSSTIWRRGAHSQNLRTGWLDYQDERRPEDISRPTSVSANGFKEEQDALAPAGATHCR
jgi:hypothetical protein